MKVALYRVRTYLNIANTDIKYFMKLLSDNFGDMLYMNVSVH
uniref:Uncharacterized protein n=1 Tax=Anguilla anguilla TaxID=7936 RepID=A0A0E9STT5_ANGAN